MQHSSRRLTLLIVMLTVIAGCLPTAAPAAPTQPTAVPQVTAPQVTAPQAIAPQATGSLPDEISAAEAAAKREAGAFILDVRQPDEWSSMHIPGATLIPLDKLEVRLSEVPRDKEVVVVCQAGGRSKQGRDLLRKAGYTQVTSMIGGMTTWSAAGYPTATGP